MKMNGFNKAVIQLWLVIGIVGLEAGSREEVFSGKVLEVVDGDTVVVVDEEAGWRVIDLYAVDAPEWDQDFGAKATKQLEDLVRGRRIWVNYLEKVSEGRFSGVVHRSGGNLRLGLGEMTVNLQMVLFGLAWPTEDSTHYEKLGAPGNRENQLYAKETGWNLWAQEKPIPPWEWRAGRASSAKQDLDVTVIGQVNRPGPLTLAETGRVTLLQALAQAGGPKDDADFDLIAVVRDGVSTRFRMDELREQRNFSKRYLIQSGDRILVPHGSKPEN